MEIPFIGGAYEGRSKNLNAQVCQNLFPVTDQTGGKSVLALYGVPGAKSWFSSGATAEVRGFCLWDGYLYAVIGATLYRLDSAASGTDVGTLSTDTGRVWMAGGTTHLGIVDGTSGYYQTSGATSLTTVTDTDFPSGPSSLAYLDGRFIVTESGTDTYYVSDSEDFSSWDALGFISAEENPDEAFAVVAYRRQLWLPGELTTEAHYGTGNSTYPFARISGAAMPIGCRSADSIAAGKEGLFFLDNSLRVVMVSELALVPISTEQITYQISRLASPGDAIGDCWTQEGHSFYAITFPTGDKTFVFDATTGLWHTRSSDLDQGRWRANCVVNFADKTLIGDYSDGNIYELDFDTYTDAGETIQAIRAAQPVHSGRKLISFTRFELDMETGVGLATGTGSDPQAMLDWSDDGGHSWSNEHWATIGAIGDRSTRVVWRRLGAARQRIFRVKITDPIKRVIIGAHLDARAGQ